MFEKMPNNRLLLCVIYQDNKRMGSTLLVQPKVFLLYRVLILFWPTTPLVLKVAEQNYHSKEEKERQLEPEEKTTRKNLEGTAK